MIDHWTINLAIVLVVYISVTFILVDFSLTVNFVYRKYVGGIEKHVLI